MLTRQGRILEVDFDSPPPKKKSLYNGESQKLQGQLSWRFNSVLQPLKSVQMHYYNITTSPTWSTAADTKLTILAFLSKI